MAIRIIPNGFNAVIEVHTDEEFLRVARLFGNLPAQTEDEDEPHSEAESLTAVPQPPQPPAPPPTSPRVTSKRGFRPPKPPAPAASAVPEAPPDGWAVFLDLVRRKPRSMALLKTIKERGIATMTEVVEGSGFGSGSEVSGAMAGLSKNAKMAAIAIEDVLTSDRNVAGEKVYTAGPLLIAWEDDEE